MSDPTMRGIQGLMIGRACREAVPEHEPQQAVVRKMASFKRGVSVAEVLTPDVLVGRVVSPPTPRNQRMLIDLAKGGQKLVEAWKYVIHKPLSKP